MKEYKVALSENEVALLVISLRSEISENNKLGGFQKQNNLLSKLHDRLLTLKEE